MKLLRTTERPEQKYSLAFVGYGSNPEHAEIELTENHGVDRYALGTVFRSHEAAAHDRAPRAEVLARVRRLRQQPRARRDRADRKPRRRPLRARHCVPIS